jgi:hypothetical protein
VNRRSVSLSVVLCLSMMITGALAGSAQQVQPLEPEWLTQMYAEGWEKVQEGVLQRDMGGGQPETFTYGAEGLQWVAQGFEQRISSLESHYNQYPSEELALAIEGLQAQVDKLNEDIQTAPSTEELDGQELASCNLAYGGNASATPLPGSRGVTATASAYFHSDCGHLGTTFAHTYGQAVTGTTLNAKTQDDSKGPGTWLDSYATVSVSGSADCRSEAQGTVYLNGNFIYQTPFAENYSCPAPSLTNSVSGYPNYYTSQSSPCAMVTWSASASGGTPGYTYDWYIGTVYYGSGSTLTLNYCYQSANVTVKAVARDSAGQSAEAFFTTNVTFSSGSTGSGGGGGGCFGTNCTYEN